MSHRKPQLKTGVFIFAVLLIVATWGRCRTGSTGVYERIREYVDTIKVINTHEHQRIFSEYEGQQLNFYSLLAHTYLQSDLVSAGATPLNPELCNGGDLDRLWELNGRYLDYCRNTSYYRQFLSGFRVLYGYDESRFTKDGIRWLSEQISKNYGRHASWYKEAFTKAGFDIMFVDQYWNNFNVSLDGDYFALVFNINNLATGMLNRSIQYRKDVPEEQNIYSLAQKEGYSIETLADYLEFARHLFQKFVDHNAVCVKNSMAYGRTLDFPFVPYERAKALYTQPIDSLSDVEKKALVDFMFHWIIVKSIEVDLPIQIHTGYLAGNGNTLANSHPLKLNNLFLRYPKAKFILFHGGYPWTSEFIAMGKMFPNVYLDLVWLPQISREAAIRTLDEMLDCVPYNKFFWGGDCHFIEESTGSLEFGKEVVSEVLARRVNAGQMSEEMARDVALRTFRENAISVFKLKEQIPDDSNS
jgi:hypothetical protein